MTVFFFCMLFAMTDDNIETDRYKSLPDWATTELLNYDIDTLPHELVRLLDRNVIFFKGDGHLYLHRQVIQIVQHPNAAKSASELYFAGDDESSKVIGFKAWHLKPGGFSEKLTKRDLVILGGGAHSSLTSGTTAYCQFRSVQRGSVLVFEFQEKISSYLGTIGFFSAGGPYFTKEFSLETQDVSDSKTSVNMESQAWGFEAWGINLWRDKNRLVAKNIPEIPYEGHSYKDPHSHPVVFVNAFVEGENRYQSWDTYANWYFEIFKRISLPENLKLEPVAPSLATLAELTEQVRNQVDYYQVYLSHARGWEPLPGKEVMDKAYGDCKDMASSLAYLCGKKNIPVYPVVASIVDGLYITENHAPTPSFNHLISAIPLKETLGLASEVVVNQQRYLIIETTSKSTPLGKLPETYLNRQVLICTPQGAAWAKVPAEAVIRSEIAFDVNGNLNENLDFTGEMTIRGTGDPVGLRSMALRSRANTMQSYLRYFLDLPPGASLICNSVEITQTDDVLIYAKLHWPGFLYSDEDGFRLPESLVFNEWHDIAKRGEPRLNPVKFDLPPKWRVRFTLASPFGFRNVEKAQSAPEATFQYHYSLNFDPSNQTLNVDYAFEGEPLFFSKKQTGEARNVWQKFITDYNRFWRVETLVRKAS